MTDKMKVLLCGRFLSPPSRKLLNEISNISQLQEYVRGVTYSQLLDHIIMSENLLLSLSVM